MSSARATVNNRRACVVGVLSRLYRPTKGWSSDFQTLFELLVEFSVSFRVIVVEQKLDAHSSQPLSTFADAEGRRYRLRAGRPASAQARDNCTSPSTSTRPTASQVAVGIKVWYDHVA